MVPPGATKRRGLVGYLHPNSRRILLKALASDCGIRSKEHCQEALLHRLEVAGLLRRDGGSYFLTDKGRARAEHIFYRGKSRPVSVPTNIDAILLVPYDPESHALVSLSQGWVAVIDKDSVDRLPKRSWHIDERASVVYASCMLKLDSGKWVVRYMHKLLCEGVEVDHRYHVPKEHKIIDNRRSNLRMATRGENLRNTRKRIARDSIFKGVIRERRKGRETGKWVANIKSGGKNKYLGSFALESLAALAYDHAAVESFGDFACTNFAVPGSSAWLYGSEGGA